MNVQGRNQLNAAPAPTTVNSLGILSRLSTDVLENNVLPLAAPNGGLRGFAQASHGTRNMACNFASHWANVMQSKSQRGASFKSAGALSLAERELVRESVKLLESFIPPPFSMRDRLRPWVEHERSLGGVQAEEAANRICAAFADEEQGCLDLEGLGLHMLPPEIGLLKHITALEIGRNHLSSLSSVGLLTNLRYLDVSENALSSLSGLDKLKKVNHLIADSNQLRDTDGIESMEGIKYLFLAHNELHNLDGIGGLKYLEVLTADYNELRNIDGLKNSPALHEVSLSKNRIACARALLSVRQLRSASLSDNLLSSVAYLKNHPSDPIFWFAGNKLPKWLQRPTIHATDLA